MSKMAIKEHSILRLIAPNELKSSCRASLPYSFTLLLHMLDNTLIQSSYGNWIFPHTCMAPVKFCLLLPLHYILYYTVHYTELYCTIQCSIVQCSIVHCSRVQCRRVKCSRVQCSKVQCSAVQ